MSDFELTGRLKLNDKQGNSARPDYKGLCTLNGVKYWISGWKNKDKETNEPYLNLKFQEAETKLQSERVIEANKQKQAPVQDDDDIPF